MAKKLQLQIADPCHENWDQMTAADKGRFCASCQKQVMDFTNMSDSQLAAFFKKPSEGSVCGRFYNDQLDRGIEIPGKRIPWVKYFFQFALPAFLISMKATAQGKVKARIVTSTASAPTCSKKIGDVEPVIRKKLLGDTVLTPVQKQPVALLVGQINTNKETTLNSTVIKGQVVDENNDPIPFASVLIKGTKIGTPTDSIGKFTLDNLTLQTGIILQVSSVGYEIKEMPVSKETDRTQELEIQLTRQVMGEVVVVAYSYVMGKMVVGGVTSSVKAEKAILNTPVINPPPETLPMIKVYPNPVISGTSINVGCQKLNEGYYAIQLSNLSGQQVLSKQTWIDAEAQVLNIDIPTVTAGVYFLKLTNKETNKRFTAKVVIE